MIKNYEAWVGEYNSLKIAEDFLGGICPDWVDVMIDGKLAQRRNPKFEMMDVHAVEFHKADEFSNIPDQVGLRPS